MGKLGPVITGTDELASAMASLSVARGEMYEFIKQLPPDAIEINDNLARMWNSLATRTGESMPMNKSIVELFAAVAAAQKAIGNTLAEAGSLIPRVHAADIARHENPRAGEDAWNV